MKWIWLKTQSTRCISLGLLALMIASCGSSSEQAESPEAETVESAESSIVASDAESGSESSEFVEAESANTQPDATVDLPSPMLTASPSSPRANLVRNTPAESRLAQVQAGRPDPFGDLVQGKPRPATPAAQPAPQTPPPAPSAQPSSPPTVTVNTAPQLPQVRPTTVATAPLNSSGLPAVPVPAQPAPAAEPLANTITVSGVVQLGDRIVAIVSVPSETTSRHVGIGDVLGDGSVRVKHIQVSDGQDPVVILEQDGQEYSRTVGHSSQFS
jgi:hypothetical protein